MRRRRHACRRSQAVLRDFESKEFQERFTVFRISPIQPSCNIPYACDNVHLTLDKPLHNTTKRVSDTGEGPGAAVRGSSPQPVLRQPSPGPCEETLQSPFFAAALAVIKAV